MRRGGRGRRRRWRAPRPSGRPPSRSARRPRAIRAPAATRVPRAASTSSTVWCSSTSRSPPATQSRSKPAWKASSVRRWSRKPIPVATCDLPLPSRPSVIRSAVSVLVRITVASRPGERAGLGAERTQEDVVLGRPPHASPGSPAGTAARRCPASRARRRGRRPSAPRRSCPRPRRHVVAGARRARSRTRSRSLVSRRGRSAARAAPPRRCGPRRRDRRRRTACLEHRCGRRCRDRVADAERRVAERLRHRPQHDRGSGTRRARGRPTRRRTRRRPRRRRPPRSGAAGRARRGLPRASPSRSGCPGCSARARHAPSVLGRRARHRSSRVAIRYSEYVGGTIDALRPGAEVRARAEEDEVVGARADDDLLPVDVGRRLLAET